MPGEPPRPGPRRLLQRGHGLRGAHGGGPGQQRAQGAGGQGEKGDRADFAGAVRRGGGVQRRHPVGLRPAGAAGPHFRQGPAQLQDECQPAGDPPRRQRLPPPGPASPAGYRQGGAHRHRAGAEI